jgi:hypothetical protein
MLIIFIHKRYCYKKKYLFLKKNISNYLISAYKELYKGINSAFKTILITTKTQIRLAEYVQKTLMLTEVYKHIKFLILTNKLVKVFTGEL